MFDCDQVLVDTWIPNKRPRLTDTSEYTLYVSIMSRLLQEQSDNNTSLQAEGLYFLKQGQWLVSKVIWPCVTSWLDSSQISKRKIGRARNSSVRYELAKPAFPVPEIFQRFQELCIIHYSRVAKYVHLDIAEKTSYVVVLVGSTIICEVV